ncbi:MAG: DUF1214 domain-containing protein [Pseudomonadota bacterium]
MRTLATIVFIVLIGCAAGLASAYRAIETGFIADAVSTPSWRGWLGAGDVDADPYTRAAAASLRDLTMASGQGLTLFADADSTGAPLEGRCTYRVRGRTPAAQWWTLSVYDRDGHRPMANPTDRYGFTSSEIVRRSDGSFEIVIAPEVQPGNYLPSDASARLTLILRLYEKPVALAGDIDPATLPSILREDCP